MQNKWQRDPNRPYKVYLEGRDGAYPSMIETIEAAKKWCKESEVRFWDDSFFSIRFTNEDDLNFFMLRWS